jgi:hydrocephalus-inducing protein
VPEPVWPDPDKEPLPPPVTHQIVKRPPTRAERKEVTRYSLWTPTAEAEGPGTTEGGQPPAEGEEGAEAVEALPPMASDVTRWVLGPKESRRIYVKFFSTRAGTYAQVLKFEIVGSLRTFELALQAGCEFPSINSAYRNVFMTHKKSRPAQPAESLLAKTFVVSENTFDFGPLLIKKDPEQRATDPSLRQINSSVLQITNNGKFKVVAAFTLASTLPTEEGGSGEKTPFILEPESMELEVDESKELTVYAFPEQARLYKDEIVCLLKDNPNPTIFPLQALGAEPAVEVDQDVVAFDRLLLGKKLTKSLTLKNVCAIPANWKLSGVEALPAEFTVSHTSGTLAPYQEQVVEITFAAGVEDKFEPQLTLEVTDTEERGIQQEVKVIRVQAEAFKISPTVTIGKDDSQLLDFGAVRVGEPKENTVTIRNEGKYPIKYNFTRKRKQTREIFTVEPEADELKPQEEKTITVRFLSQKEIKLRTTASSAPDLILNILEGESQDVHQPIPIGVNVNAVFSKYSITPLKTINFGPMQYGEQVTRTFEVRNEGLFDFKYAICDDADREAKNKIKEERAKEAEERLHGAQEAQEDPKAAAKGKKPDAKAAGKGKAAAGKEVVPDGTLLTVGQYDVSPATGSIPPGNAAVVSVTFRAEGAKFYESTLALDIADRDPQEATEGLPFELSAESSIPGINTADLDQVFEEQTVIPSLDPSLNTQTIISSSLYSI